MTSLSSEMSALAPALAFLLAGVPLATLLDRLGFFSSVASLISSHQRRGTSVGALWILASLTTIILNLDTTIVLLTPLYLQIARRSNVDPLPLVTVPLLLASLSSSVFPISNLTNLIVVGRLHVNVVAFPIHLGLPASAATGVAWILYRRRFPGRLPLQALGTIDQRALRVGGVCIVGLLIGFVFGPTIHIEPWLVALIGDVILMFILRANPWKSIPLLTAIGVSFVGLLTWLVFPSSILGVLNHGLPTSSVGLASLGGLASANVVNNLPALLVGLNGVSHMTWGMWAWLLGVNVGAVLLPFGALANILWYRILRTSNVRVSIRQYVNITFLVAFPACLAAIAVLMLERSLGLQ
jgi:arsenical pump membrane protein